MSPGMTAEYIGLNAIVKMSFAALHVVPPPASAPELECVPPPSPLSRIEKKNDRYVAVPAAL